jgi:type IV secretion system protein VirD4
MTGPQRTLSPLLISPSNRSLHTSQIGFYRRIEAQANPEPLLYTGERHLITIASTGSGKGRSVIIPNLLEYEGSVIVLDVKGELYNVTAKQRKRMGNRVILLDPFRIIGGKLKRDALNLFDLIDLSDDVLFECQSLAAQLCQRGNHSDKYWDDSARSLMAGLIAYVFHKNPRDEKNMRAVINILNGGDLDYDLAVILDTEKNLPRMITDAIKSHLNTPASPTRACIDSTVNSHLYTFSNEKILDSVDKSTFKLTDMVKGKPIDIYIAFPPDKLNSHNALFLQWVLLLIRAIVSRKKLPDRNTLFILDEADALGSCDQLSDFMTLCRGYGAQMWLFWQNASQLVNRYKHSYKTILSNSGIIQVFGIANITAAADLADMLHLRRDMLMNLKDDEQLVQFNKEILYPLPKFDYLNDERFKGKFDANPYHRRN